MGLKVFRRFAVEWQNIERDKRKDLFPILSYAFVSEEIKLETVPFESLPMSVDPSRASTDIFRNRKPEPYPRTQGLISFMNLLLAPLDLLVCMEFLRERGDESN